MESEKVTMLHGGGGVYMQRLIREHLLPRFSGLRSRFTVELPLQALADSAVVEGVAFTTDSYTVTPIFFPGGDIGRLSVAGTVNDLSMVGAEPAAISCALVIEEGLSFRELDKVLDSVRETAEEAGVEIVTGDTKVVERGKLEKLIINTSGIGVRSRLLDRNLKAAGRTLESRWLSASNLRPGDKLILTGALGDHAVAVMLARGEMGFQAPGVRSDVAPLNGLMEAVLEVGGVVAAKDPTRGGLAALLNEWADASGLGILVDEEAIPIHEGVRAACDILGIEFYELANEGKAVLAVAPERAGEVVEALRSHRLGREAEIIGEVTSEYEGVVIRTGIGGLRYLPAPMGDPVPRIC